MGFRTLTRGLMAGAAATVPMTAVMGVGKAAGWMVTPPPKQITARAQRESGLRRALDRPAFTVSWLGAHVAFGTACGALFVETRQLLPESAMVAGISFGTAIWAVAYGAVLPALNLYPNLADDSRSRTVVMLAAHEVFGITLAVIS